MGFVVVDGAEDAQVVEVVDAGVAGASGASESPVVDVESAGAFLEAVEAVARGFAFPSGSFECFFVAAFGHWVAFAHGVSRFRYRPRWSAVLSLLLPWHGCCGGAWHCGQVAVSARCRSVCNSVIF